MSATVVTVTYCAGGGVALQLPFAVWFGITVIGFFYSGELALLCLSVSYYPQLYINYVLKQVLQQPYPEAGCRTGLDSPSLECQLASSFSIFVLTFNALRGCKSKYITILILLFLWLGVPLILFHTQNSSSHSVLFGTMLGTSCGLLLALVVHLYLSPHFDSMTQWCLFRLLGYCNNFYHHKPTTETRSGNSADALEIPSRTTVDYLLPQHNFQ